MVMDKSLILLSHTLVDAYSWGHAAKAAPAPFRNMEEVKAAAGLPGAAGLKVALEELLSVEGQGTGLMAKVDAALDQHAAFEDLREYLIDLCVLQLLGELEEEDEEAYESPAWLKIEHAAADRGTELLNALIYIKECKNSEIAPSLEDFLYEFLMADDEDYQDELEIYEPFVKGQELIDSPLKQLVQAGNHQRDAEMRELFTPMMLFFRDAEAAPGKVTLAILESSALPELHCALYRLLCEAWAGEL